MAKVLYDFLWLICSSLVYNTLYCSAAKESGFFTVIMGFLNPVSVFKFKTPDFSSDQPFSIMFLSVILFSIASFLKFQNNSYQTLSPFITLSLFPLFFSECFKEYIGIVARTGGVRTPAKSSDFWKAGFMNPVKYTRPIPIPKPIIVPKRTIFILFGLNGFSGKLAGSIILNFSPFCLFSRFSASLALSFLLKRDL